MATEAVFLFDDDNKMKYIYSRYHQKMNGSDDNPHLLNIIIMMIVKINFFLDTVDRIYPASICMFNILKQLCIMMITRRGNVPASEYGLSVIMCPIVCTHHRLHGGNGNKNSSVSPLQWRHNGCHDISNYQPYHSLLNRLFRRRSKKTSKLRVTGLCAGNSSVVDESPAQMTSNAENVSVWWRHHGDRYKATERIWRFNYRALTFLSKVESGLPYQGALLYIPILQM